MGSNHKTEETRPRSYKWGESLKYCDFSAQWAKAT